MKGIKNYKLDGNTIVYSCYIFDGVDEYGYEKTTGCAIYKANNDGTKKKKIATFKENTGTPIILGVKDEWVYYLLDYGNKSAIYRISDKTKEKVKLVKENENLNQYSIGMSSSKIFYTLKNEIWSCNLDGTKKVKIAEHKEVKNANSYSKITFEVVGNWVYYSANGINYRTKVNKNEMQLVTKYNVSNVSTGSVYKDYLKTAKAYDASCTKYAIIDIDGDKVNELIVANSRDAYVYQYKDKKFQLIHQISCNDYESLFYKKGQKCIYMRGVGVRGNEYYDIHILNQGKFETHFLDSYGYQYDGKGITLKKCEEIKKKYITGAKEVVFTNFE